MEHRFEMVAKTFKGLEEVLADELRELGAVNVEPGRRMVSFEGDLAMLYRANICCRTALCILKIILSVHSRQRLHRSPLRIAALLRDLPAQIIRHVNDILHQSFHILEDLGIDLLQNILLPSRGLHGKGMIDVPAAVRPHRHDLLPRKELLQTSLVPASMKLLPP